MHPRFGSGTGISKQTAGLTCSPAAQLDRLCGRMVGAARGAGRHACGVGGDRPRYSTCGCKFFFPPFFGDSVSSIMHITHVCAIQRGNCGLITSKPHTAFPKARHTRRAAALQGSTARYRKVQEMGIEETRTIQGNQGQVGGRPSWFPHFCLDLPLFDLLWH